MKSLFPDGRIDKDQLNFGDLQLFRLTREQQAAITMQPAKQIDLGTARGSRSHERFRVASSAYAGRTRSSLALTSGRPPASRLYTMVSGIDLYARRFPSGFCRLFAIRLRFHALRQGRGS